MPSNKWNKRHTHLHIKSRMNTAEGRRMEVGTLGKRKYWSLIGYRWCQWQGPSSFDVWSESSRLWNLKETAQVAHKSPLVGLGFSRGLLSSSRVTQLSMWEWEWTSTSVPQGQPGACGSLLPWTRFLIVHSFPKLALSQYTHGFQHTKGSTFLPNSPFSAFSLLAMSMPRTRHIVGIFSSKAFFYNLGLIWTVENHNPHGRKVTLPTSWLRIV